MDEHKQRDVSNCTSNDDSQHKHLPLATLHMEGSARARTRTMSVVCVVLPTAMTKAFLHSGVSTDGRGGERLLRDAGALVCPQKTHGAITSSKAAETKGSLGMLLGP